MILPFFMERKKKRIALFFLGGNISLYKDPETKCVFSISSKKDIQQFLPHLEDSSEVKLYSSLPTQKASLGLLDWRVVYNKIKERADAFDGFVIAQETDSLLFGAALFSYLFSSFGKPIIFTASATVLGEKNGFDTAQKNIQDAVAFAGMDISEVAISSHGQLVRATRAKRSNISSDSLFLSSGIDDIGSCKNGEYQLHIHRYNRDNNEISFPYEYPEKNVFFVKLFPDFNPEYFEEIIHKKHLDAVMIESLGYGSMRPDLLKTIEEISLSGIKVVILAKYDNDERRFFLSADTISSPYIVSIKNIPTWSAFAKVHFASQNSFSSFEFRKLMMEDLNGEIVG